jgi:hypothetical protein
MILGLITLALLTMVAIKEIRRAHDRTFKSVESNLVPRPPSKRSGRTPTPFHIGDGDKFADRYRFVESSPIDAVFRLSRVFITR